MQARKLSTRWSPLCDDCTTVDSEDEEEKEEEEGKEEFEICDAAKEE